MRSILVSSILCAAFAFTGCAADGTNSPEPSVEAESLAYVALVAGNYDRQAVKGSAEFYETLTLKTDGTYTGTLPSKDAPIDEYGTFNASGSSGAVTSVTLHPHGGAAAKYIASVASDRSGIKLGLGGKTEYFQTSPSYCGSDADCVAGQECLFVSNCPPATAGSVTCHSGRQICVNVAEAGESCGFRTQSITCARGLDCVHVGGPLDALTCAPHTAQYGESCGGFVANAAQCADGLACSHVAADGSSILPDLPGVCLEDIGSPCEGFVATQHVCANGATCQLDPGTPDAPGVCQ
jgi:hypothetical protein